MGVAGPPEPESGRAVRARGPLFVGGVQRSGTHALAHLVSRHSQYAMIPHEVVFHAAVGAGGLPDLIEGRTSLEEFTERLRTYWWSRSAPWDPAVTRGLHKSVPEPRFRAAVDRFTEAFPSDAYGAARTLLRELLDPVSAEAGKPAWIEMSPTNVLAAPLLLRLFPDMKLIHSIRDGRDVACSIVRLPWGPSTVTECIRMWKETLERADAATREVPADRVLVLHLEDLVVNDRKRTYARLLQFLELEDEPAMAEFFASQITAENAHLGRWRRELPMRRRVEATARYSVSLARLARAGVGSRPSLRALRAKPASVEYRPGAEAIDPWADGKAGRA